MMDLIWGNGESALKLAISVGIVMTLMLMHHIFIMPPLSLKDTWRAVGYMPQIFFGIEKPDNYTGSYLTIISSVRLVFFGFFMSILVKRFSKR